MTFLASERHEAGSRKPLAHIGRSGTRSPNVALVVTMCLISAGMISATIVRNGETVDLMPWLFLVVSFAISAWSVGRCWRRRSAARTNSALLPIIIGASFIPIVVIPVLSQASGDTTSKLSRTGLVREFDVASNAFPIAILSMSIIVAGIFAGIGGELGSFEKLDRWGFGGSFTISNPDRLRWTHSVFLAVALVGFVVSLISGGDDLQSRGDVQGAGFSVMLSWCLPLAVAMGFAYRNFGDRWRFFASVSGIVLLILGDVRSPILLVFIGIVIGAVNTTIYDDRIRSRGTYVRSRMVLLLLLAVVTALVSAFISSWRGSRLRNENVTAFEVLADVLADPFNYVALSGLDSYDGIRLALAAKSAGYEASVFDPLKGVVNLIPRSIYTDKHGWLGNDLALNFLGWEKGGMFLSGVGYFYVVFGSLVLAFLAIAIVGAVLGFIEARAGTNMMAVTLCCYFALRFLMGGDAFDIQHVLMLALVCLAVAFLAQVSSMVFKPRRSRESEIVT